MASESILDIHDPRAEASDPVVILVNIRTGRLREIPCGAGDAAHFSGARLVYWNDRQRRAEIPAKHKAEWRFYADYCADPAIAAAAGLTVAQSKRYADAYAEFVRARGVGAKAQIVELAPEQLARLWHPTIRKLRAEHKEARGQRRVSTEAVQRIIDELERDAKAVAAQTPSSPSPSPLPSPSPSPSPSPNK